MLASQLVWELTKSVSIPAEEQNAGRVVDYFYRMEFHITPVFFPIAITCFFFFCKKTFILLFTQKRALRSLTVSLVLFFVAQKAKFCTKSSLGVLLISLVCLVEAL